MSDVKLEVIQDGLNFYLSVKLNENEIMMVEFIEKQNVSLVTRQQNKVMESSLKDLDKLSYIFKKVPKIISKIIKGERVPKEIILGDTYGKLRAFKCFQEGSLLDESKGLLIYAPTKDKARYLLCKSFDGFTYRLVSATREPNFDEFSTGDTSYIVAKNEDLPDNAPNFYRQASKIV